MRVRFYLNKKDGGLIDFDMGIGELPFVPEKGDILVNEGIEYEVKSRIVDFDRDQIIINAEVL